MIVFCVTSPRLLRKTMLLTACLLLAAPRICFALSIIPASLVQRAGDHLAFLGLTNGVNALGWQWQCNGTNLPGQTSTALSLTNVQLTNAGTYTLVANTTGGPVSASATLTVSNGYLPLASSNLVVARIGDGVQSLNTTTGNTLYLDQIATNGNYISTVMVPDSGANALIAEGSGSAGLDGSVLTLSSNGQYLNFTGYNQALPNTGVTFTGASVPRAIGAINGLGFYTLCLTNYGLYNTSAGQVRAAVSIDGIVNTFWTAGVASSGSASIKTLTFNQGQNGISGSGAGNDPRGLAIVSGNLWVTSGNNNAGQSQGLYAFAGMPNGSVTASLQFATGSASDPNDFAVSPDDLTIYVADSDNYTASTGVGGIERWDYNGSAWVFHYSLATGAGNWGARGLTVDFSHFTGGGASSFGAVIYATTAEMATNRLIQIVDTNGPGAAVNVLSSAGPNQLYRGVRFGPSSASPAAMESNADEINVKTFGAKGDGVTDDTAAFQSALSSGKSHNGVLVPMGRYVISGSLTITTEELTGKFIGGWPADTMPMPTLLIRQTTAPALILTNGASLHGIAILYDQAVPTTSNAPAISLRGNGISISSVRIQNPYDGMNTYSTSTPGRPRFSDIYIVNPAHIGLQMSRSYDFNQFRHIEVRCSSAMSSGPAFALGRMDEGNYTGLLASNCLTGLEFDHDPSTSPAGGDFTGGFAGCSVIACSNAVVVSNGLHKIKISGGDFSAANGAIINGASEVMLNGGQWSISSGPAVQVLSASNVIVDACMFGRPAPVAAPLVTANSCTTLTLSHCQLLPGSTGIVLGANLSRAILLGNSLEDGAISNFMTSGKIVSSSSLVTASAPIGLAAVAGSRQVTLTWDMAIGANSYNVKRSLVSGGSYATVANVPGTVFVDTGISNGTTYYYVVSAVRTAGESANSAQASATPQAPGLTWTFPPGGTQLTLAWPGWATNFNLYMTTNLSLPSSWLPVTNQPQSNNGFFNLALPATNGGQEFFELQSQ